MAQTENGQKVYTFYTNTSIGTLEFAHDWMAFFLYLDQGNQMYSWHKWCDEFAEWVIDYDPEGIMWGLPNEPAINDLVKAQAEGQVM